MFIRLATARLPFYRPLKSLLYSSIWRSRLHPISDLVMEILTQVVFRVVNDEVPSIVKPIYLSKRRSQPVWPDVAKFRHFDKLKNFNLLGSIFCHWAKVHWCVRPNIENIIYPSSHTDHNVPISKKWLVLKFPDDSIWTSDIWLWWHTTLPRERWRTLIERVMKRDGTIPC